MVEASKIVLNGFPIRVDDEVCHAPDLLGLSGCRNVGRVNQLVPDCHNKGCQQCQIPFLILISFFNFIMDERRMHQSRRALCSLHSVHPCTWLQKACALKVGIQ